MAGKNILAGKRILVVDDEQDILDTLIEMLDECEIETAYTFESAEELLKTKVYDAVILDIMGVDGYALLEIANSKKIPVVMLTAHALSVQDTVKSFKNGAASYVPKEKMTEIATFLNDILEARENGKSHAWRWLDRLGSYYDKKFGSDWKKHDKEFWEKFKRIQYWR